MEHIQGCDWKRAAIVWAFTYDAPRGHPANVQKEALTIGGFVSARAQKTVLPADVRQAIGLTAATKKGNRKMGKKNDDAELAKAIGVSLAGGSSTVIDRMTDAELAAMVRSAGRQTQANNTAGRSYPLAVLKAFEDRVTDAKARYAAAGNDYEKTSATVELEAALRNPCRWRRWSSPRTFGRNGPGSNRSRYGPNSVDLFNGSSLNDRRGPPSQRFLTMAATGSPPSPPTLLQQYTASKSLQEHPPGYTAAERQLSSNLAKAPGRDRGATLPPWRYARPTSRSALHQKSVRRVAKRAAKDAPSIALAKGYRRYRRNGGSASFSVWRARVAAGGAK